MLLTFTPIRADADRFLVVADRYRASHSDFQVRVSYARLQQLSCGCWMAGWMDGWMASSRKSGMMVAASRNHTRLCISWCVEFEGRRMALCGILSHDSKSEFSFCACPTLRPWLAVRCRRSFVAVSL